MAKKEAKREESKQLENQNNNSNEKFSFLEPLLKQKMIPAKKVLTHENKKLFSQMEILYDLEEIELEKVILRALNDDNNLDTEKFKKDCHKLFAIKQGVPKTKEEALIKELETISNKKLLSDLSKGGMVSEQDLKIIQEVREESGLSEPVMNVVIHYVLLQTNMKLTKNYMMKIAKHWERAGITTVRGAMSFAKAEATKYRRTSVNNSGKSPTNDTTQKPEWIAKEKTPQGKTLYQKITEAIDKGFTDEQLGFFVRNIVNR